MTVVVPIDVHRLPAICEKTYNVLTDHATLHVAMVANSTSWIQTGLRVRPYARTLRLPLNSYAIILVRNYRVKHMKSIRNAKPTNKEVPLCCISS